MTQRFCPLCASEVEDLGGYCRLGHRLRLDSPQASLTQLREEVDRAFADSEPVPDQVLAEVGAGSAAARPVAGSYGGNGAIHPPAAQRESTRRPGPIDDPITAFAPPPRMDWGPPRPWKSRLNSLRTRWGSRRRA
jgi:hypothetical protein